MICWESLAKRPIRLEFESQLHLVFSRASIGQNFSSGAICVKVLSSLEVILFGSLMLQVHQQNVPGGAQRTAPRYKLISCFGIGCNFPALEISELSGV